VEEITKSTHLIVCLNTVSEEKINSVTRQTILNINNPLRKE